MSHVHGEDGWYAARPSLAGCRCGSCEDEDPEVRYLICNSLIHDPQHEYVIDCEYEITPEDVDNFDELWRNARF